MRWLRGLLLGSSLAIAGMLGLGSNVAGAVSAEPLRITKFSMEATRATRISQVGQETEIVNEPYVPAFTQAAGHPWGLTTTVEFANEELPGSNDGARQPTHEPKDVVVSLPPGLLGNPLAVPRCSLTQAFAVGVCPASTQVGVYRVIWLGGKEKFGPIADVVPEKGQSAEFALLNEAHVSAGLTGHLVRAPETITPEGAHVPGPYELTVSSNGIPTVQLYRVETTFWGVPADPSHNPLRGLQCGRVAANLLFGCEPGTGGQASGTPLVPFLTWGADCAAGPETATLRADSWEEPGSVHEQHYEGYVEQSVPWPAATGCDRLSFGPTVEVRPDTELADEPVGVNVHLRVPLNEEPESEGTPPLRNAVLTLPQGMSIGPGAVDGIQACDAFGPHGIDMTGPESEAIGPSGELQLASGHCPDASIVGSAEAITPLLDEPVRGHVYLARPGCGGAGQAPCTEADVRDGNLYKLYLELGGEGELASTGVHIKVEGRTEVDPATGQLTSVFEDNPQTPFSELKVHLNEGPKAPIDNPAVCGPAVTTAELTPWSAPGLTPEGVFVAGTPNATPFSYFDVTGCASPTPFAPSFQAGTVIPQAGQFSPFVLNLVRQDREQYVKGIQVHTPPGLLGMLSSVPLCQEPQANLGSCSEASRIGTTRTATGAGSHPFEIGGDVYLTGPYRGAPFGLSVVVHVVAGPFNLGIVVVRARIEVDPQNSTLTVTTDETGPHAVPQIVFGVPTRIRQITVEINRPGFMFNPTNCAAQQIGASVSGSQDAVANVSSPFAVGGCKSLGFDPIFKVSTAAHTSRAIGASLDTKLSYPAGSLGNDANIAKVKVALPKQLPSRLTTLQKACLAKVFEANPAACPAASIVGIVRSTTPVLPVQLSGPVYFVSHGGEAFPSLIVVLQGDGVRVDLTGTTFINKQGITSSTFNTVPDVPVNTFELYLPQGRYSALAANGNLCKPTKTVTVKQKLTRRVHGRVVHATVKKRVSRPASLLMPTEFVAQNGIVLHRETKIEVTGCARTRASAARRKTGVAAPASDARRRGSK